MNILELKNNSSINIRNQIVCLNQILLSIIFTMRSINNIAKKIFFGFSSSKKPSLKLFFKTLHYEQKKTVQVEQLSQDEKENYENAHRLLYVQYMPTLLLFLPATYFLGTPTDPSFLQCCNILQYYSSGLLCFNTFFNQANTAKFLPFVVGVGMINMLPGHLSILAPLLLGAINFYVPFTDEKMIKSQNTEQLQKYKSYLRTQGVFYFIVVIIATFKLYYFIEVREMQKKIKKYEKQNKQYFESKLAKDQ